MCLKMISPAEQHLARGLRAILADLPVGESIARSESLREVLNSLEFFVPEVLAEIHSEWKQESLDGVFPVVARKIADREAEIFGLCIIISDQSLTPIRLRVQLAIAGDAVSWLECRLGERGPDGMARWPYRTLGKQLHCLEGRAETIDWVYQVTYGEHRA